MVEAPRIWKSGKALGLLPDPRFSICMKEGSMFFKLCSTLLLPTFCRSAPFTVVTAPVKVLAFRVKVPFTTTSSTCLLSGERAIVILSVARTFLGVIPIYDTTSLAPRGHLLKEKCPSTSVTTTSLVPMILTVAPMTGMLSSADTTVPLRVLFSLSYDFCGSRRVTFTKLPS